jgi:hypothetical protein
MARWEWWSGPWRERDACGAWCSQEDVENDRQDEICRNGGTLLGPHSRTWYDRRGEVEEGWRNAQHAAYEQAVAATNGVMVRKGAPAGTTDQDMYPLHPRHRPPLRWASEELMDFWNGGGQRPMTLREFRGGLQTQFAHPLDWS